MADAVATKTLVDGERNVVMHFTNVSDGTGESAVTKVDVSALSGAPSEVKIMKVKWATNGMSVRILWDATADAMALELPAGTSDELCFEDAGGLINNAGSGKTGDVQFTTVGHTAGDTYAITLHMRKRG